MATSLAEILRLLPDLCGVTKPYYLKGNYDEVGLPISGPLVNAEEEKASTGGASLGSEVLVPKEEWAINRLTAYLLVFSLTSLMP